MNYTTNLVTRDTSKFESSIAFQENGLAELSSGSIVENQLPLRLNSNSGGNSTSTEESSEGNLNLVGQAEVDYFPRTYRFHVCPQ